MPVMSKPVLLVPAAVVLGAAAQAFVAGPSTERQKLQQLQQLQLEQQARSFRGANSQGTASTGSADSVAGAGSGATSLAAASCVAVATIGLAVGRPRSEHRAARASCRATKQEDTVAAPAAEAAEAAPDASVEQQLEASAGLDLPVAVPFLGAPAYRTFVANVPGDSGFDPLNFGKDMDTFRSMQEAEIKHARLAMLAAVGWPIAELDEPSIAASWGMPNALAKGGMAPSVLNGGLLKGGASPTVGFFVGVFLLVAAIIDLSKMPETAPGFYNFDPLNLKGFTPPMSGMLPKGRQWMNDAELKNGRLAMVAITAFAFQEFATKVPVVNETPFLFKAPF